MSASQEIILNEGRALFYVASLLGDSLKERREVIEQMVDEALRRLYIEHNINNKVECGE